ncbi:MAG: hypothetical protein WB947_04255 [Thermoplasmata archaeon]
MTVVRFIFVVIEVSVGLAAGALLFAASGAVTVSSLGARTQNRRRAEPPVPPSGPTAPPSDSSTPPANWPPPYPPTN